MCECYEKIPPKPFKDAADRLGPGTEQRKYSSETF